MGLLLLLGQMSLVEVGLVGMVGTEVVAGRNDGVRMNFRRERINGRGVECVFTIWCASCVWFMGVWAFWYRGFCCLSSSGYVSVFCLFSLVCVYLTIASCTDVTFRGFLFHCYICLCWFFGFLYVISEGWVG